MFGYEISKTYDMGRSQYNYQFLRIIFYYQDDFGYRDVAEIKWQTDSGEHTNYWYGFHIVQTRDNYIGDFEEFLKLGKTLLPIWGQSPREVIEFLEQKRGFTQVIHDTRINETVTLKTYLETKDHEPYKVYYKGQYIMPILAKPYLIPDNVAIDLLTKDNRYNIVKDFINVNVEFNNVSLPEIFEIDEWSKIVW